jgi:hypothetical protein
VRKRANDDPWVAARSIGCVLSLTLAAGGCTSIAQDLDTVSVAYRDARYELASAWLEQLSADLPAMDLRQRARFHYLRGMTAYRLYQYPEALHDLALAASAVAATGDALSDAQRAILDQTLAEVVLMTSYASARP